MKYKPDLETIFYPLTESEIIEIAALVEANKKLDAIRTLRDTKLGGLPIAQAEKLVTKIHDSVNAL